MLGNLQALIPAFVLAGVLTAAPALAQTLAERLQSEFDAGGLPGLHGTIIDLGDQRLAEVYFAGPDERWGMPLGKVQHNPESLHDLRSVTKSVVGLLYGIALAEDKVPSPDAPLYAQFPEYEDLQAQDGRDKILVSHALSMQMGLRWNEDLPYTDPRNSEIAMEQAPDRYRYALEQDIIEAPGTNWIYSGGAVALLGKLIADGTGMPLDAFAREKLFAPLGITEFEWIAGTDGVPSAASGLRLKMPDLAKIGRLVAQDGVHEGKEVVPADWLNQSFQPRATVNEFTKYGYLWYLAGEQPNIVVIAVGNGGQRLTVQPAVDLSVATFAGRYNDRDAWRTSLKVVLDIAVPEAKRILGR
ncbi:serine hydrolase domain-containing protein [Hoeflea prorocentri]|uniref:Serine hydrolase n=1 Tax=Hoeflea prorocentri TaxID=1922333 RepID=A0A9X3ZFD5_9HYPH|nr:serine hydrolase [Hoeflea prorocentri]MCY6379542.1 serine hydrolase [Hoeflea prorocentri]MDA5397342.1 serine hydrolase [Hoeflea prorocentri]